MCSLKEEAHRVIRRLSHGFKRRVGLAEALLGSPQLLLLDEPTNGLDPEQVVQIRKLLFSLKSTHTLLIASHVLSELELLCDRFLIVSKGVLKACGSRQELLALSKQNTRLHLEISEVDENFISKLRAISGVDGVFVSRDLCVKIVLTMHKQAADPRATIQEALKNLSGVFLQMRLEMPNLESLYLELTRDE
jgi:ABC-2 type transport system ATP-binding protein